MDGLRSKVVAFAKSFVVPIRTDQLEPLPAIQWTPWRKLLLVIMLASGGWVLWQATYPSITLLLHIMQHDGAVTLTETPRQEKILSVIANYCLLVAASLLVLGCMGGIGGKQATGLFRPMRMHAAALGYYMRTAYPGMAIVAIVYSGVAQHFEQIQNLTAKSGEVDTTVQHAHLLSITQAVASGIAEEIVATVLVYGLLNHVPGPKGKTLAASGWGTLIIIAVHLMYHTYYGLGLIMVVPSVYFSVVCWRRMRSLPAIMAGHALYDLMLLAPKQMLPWLFAGALFIGSSLDSEPRRAKQLQTT